MIQCVQLAKLDVVFALMPQLVLNALTILLSMVPHVSARKVST